MQTQKQKTKEKKLKWARRTNEDIQHFRNNDEGKWKLARVRGSRRWEALQGKKKSNKERRKNNKLKLF